MRRHAVFVDHQVSLEIVGIHAAGDHFFNLGVVVMDALAAGRDFEAAEQQVEAQGEMGVGRVVLGVEGAFLARIVGDEDEVTAGQFLEQFTDQTLFFRFEVVGILDPAVVFLGNHLLGNVETNLRDLRGVRQLDVE